MVAEIGFGSLFVSLIVSVYGVIAAIYGVQQSPKEMDLECPTGNAVSFSTADNYRLDP